MAIIEKLLEYLAFLKLSPASISDLLPASGPGPGWLFGALGTVVISVCGLSIGKTRAILSLLSVYVAFVFDRLFPFFDKIQNIAGSSLAPYWVHLGIFILVYISVYIIFSTSLIRQRISSAEFSLFGVAIISILQLGFLVSIFYSFLPIELAKEWSFGFYNFFRTPLALFLWAVMPLPILLFIKRK